MLCAVEILDMIPIGIQVHNTQGEIFYLNKRRREQLGIPNWRKRISRSIGVFSPFPKYCSPRFCGLRDVLDSNFQWLNWFWARIFEFSHEIPRGR